MALWLLVAVLLLRGLASVAAPREAPPPAPVPKAESPAWPDDAARAFAADFARAYLSYSPSDPAESIAALQPFVAPGLARRSSPTTTPTGTSPKSWPRRRSTAPPLR